MKPKPKLKNKELSEKDWFLNFSKPAREADEKFFSQLIAQGYAKAKCLPQVGCFLWQRHFDGHSEIEVLTRCIKLESEAAIFELVDERHKKECPVDAGFLIRHVAKWKNSFPSSEERDFWIYMNVNPNWVQCDRSTMPGSVERQEFKKALAKYEAEYADTLSAWEKEALKEIIEEGFLLWIGAMEGAFWTMDNIDEVRDKDARAKLLECGEVEWISAWGPARAVLSKRTKTIRRAKPEYTPPLQPKFTACDRYAVFEKIEEFLGIKFDLYPSINKIDGCWKYNYRTTSPYRYWDLVEGQTCVFKEYLFVADEEEFQVFERDVLEFPQSKGFADGIILTSLESDGFWNK